MSHLRRQDREITDSAHIEHVLSTGRFAAIALADGDEPYVVTLSYGYDPQRSRLCFHVATAGRKLDIIARNPRACATVILESGYREGKCAHPYQSVVMTGRMRVLEDVEEARTAMHVLVSHLESAENREAIWAHHDLSSDAAFARISMLEFTIDEVCAKEGE